MIVKSFGNHWSAGLRWDIEASTSENYNFNTAFLPSIEYDIYPYSEATHRQFRILYSVGYEYSNYTDSTIYDKTEEGLFKHMLRAAYQVQKKWGSVNVSLRGANYLVSVYKVSNFSICLHSDSFSGDVSTRLVIIVFSFSFHSVNFFVLPPFTVPFRNFMA